jgi:hypothetical protein
MIGPFYVGQVPATPLLLTVYDSEGQPRNVSGYDTITLLMLDPSGQPVDTSGGTTGLGSTLGQVTYAWPATSLFTIDGTYRLQLALDGPPPVHDLTPAEAFDVLAAGVIDVVPESEQLALFWGDEAPTSDANWDDRADASLRAAADLLYMVTGITDLPSDARSGRLVQYAIMDMAIKLYVAEPSEAYSTYDGERIGSYSYTLRRGAEGQTGLFWWDMVVSAIRSGDWDAGYSLLVNIGEAVFTPGYGLWVTTERLLHAAPYVSTPGAFESGLFVDPSPGANRWLPYGGTDDGSWAGDPYAWPWT